MFVVWRETGNSSLGASFHSLLLLSPSQPGLSVQVPAELMKAACLSGESRVPRLLASLRGRVGESDWVTGI